MKHIVGLAIALLLLLTGCGQFDRSPRLEQQSSLEEPTQSRSDYTEEQVQFSQTEYAFVALKSPPAASYEGGIGNLKRTKPEPGHRFDQSSPAAQAYLEHLKDEHADFRSYLRQQAGQAEIVEELFVTLNAVAVKLNGADLATLARGPGVRVAEYSALYRPTMSASAGIVGADTMWSDHGLTGAGVKVAIIDSGVDANHEFFTRCGKSIGGPKVYASGSAFDPSNILVNDHGTHVAGTIGGCSGTAGPVGLTLSGVAPDAELHDYNVFPGFGGGYVAFGGSAFSHDIASAIEEAVLDGMDVINMSLGGSVEGPYDFLAEASNSAVDAGVVVVAAAGNSGPDQYTVGSPASGEKVLAVAATTNAHAIVLPVEVDYDGDGNSDDSFSAAEGEFDPFREKPANAVALVLAANFGDELACTELDPLPGNPVVLIERGECTFSTKVANAAAAGAFGAIIYNHTPSEGAIAMAGAGTIPAVGISYEDGTTILSNFGQGDTIVSIDGGAVVVEPVTADVLAGFSSRGPTPFTGLIKPEIAAPGVNILSSVFGDEYSMFSGTSMASPHVAGAAALLLSSNPALSPTQVKAALVNAGDPIVDPETGSEYLIHEVGNGRLDIPAAFDLDFLVDPPSASFGYHNLGGHSKVRAVHLEVIALDGSASCTAESGSSDVSVSPTSFTVSTTSTLEVSLNDADSRSGDAEGFVTVNCDGQTVRIPWASYSEANVPF